MRVLARLYEAIGWLLGAVLGPVVFRLEAFRNRPWPDRLPRRWRRGPETVTLADGHQVIVRKPSKKWW